MKKKIFAVLTVCMMICVCSIISASAEEELLFKTDFDSYQIWDYETGAIGEPVTATAPENFGEGRHYIKDKLYANPDCNPQGILALNTDDGHGTVVSIDNSQWYQVLWVEVPQTALTNQDKVLLSFDFKMPVQGRLFVNGDGFNFGLTLEGPNLRSKVADQELGEDKLFKNVIDMQKWSRIEVFLDYTEEKYIIYVNGKPLGKFSMPENTLLNWITFRKPQGGTMYIDNLEVKKVTDAPHMDAVTASIASNKVNATRGTVKVNFSANVNTDTLTTENIKVFDIENNTYVDGIMLENATADSVVVNFAGKLSAGKQYRIELANIQGTIEQQLGTTQIPFETFAAEQGLIFKTDFDSYTIGNGDPVQSKFESLPYADNIFRADSENAKTQVSGFNYGEEYGNVMEFGSGDWNWLNVNGYLPSACSGIIKVSFDFNMLEEGTIKMFGNNGSNYGVIFQGKNLVLGSDHENGQPSEMNVIDLDTWNKVEFYIDNTNKIYRFVLNGRTIGGDRNLEGDKTPLQLVQFHHISGGTMYIDNLEVKTVDEMPTETPTLSIAEDGENVIVNYAADKKAKAFAAAYDENGSLIAVDAQEGESGDMTFPKLQNAVLYKAFLWDENYAPLINAKVLE